MEQLYCASRVVFCIFFCIFSIFEHNSPFSKGYSLCIVAIFANFQNGLIFRILAVFWTRPFHGTALLCF